MKRLFFICTALLLIAVAAVQATEPIVFPPLDGCPGLITSLNCASAINTGQLVEGIAAAGVSISVSFTGGDGGPYNAKSISSTGVTGLTASISAGNFAVGDGTLTYTISGTPSGAGTASFALSIGGKRCTMDITVYPVASISALNCASSTDNGTLTNTIAASGVSSAIPYTGGNGGVFGSQRVFSTGVTGLTATLSAGIVASGSGSLNYTISGTPSGKGTASFALSFGGQSCVLTRTVDPLLASVAAVDSSSLTNNGTLYEAISASSIITELPYLGGNGGEYDAQSVSSTSVTGLTASLSAGTVAVGTGSLTYTITGIAKSSGTARFALIIGGKSYTLSRTVTASYPAGSVHCNATPTTIVEVTSATGKTWMDRNLGATRAATILTDTLAYGDLYQWGRRSDGHQCRNSATIITQSSSDTPNHGLFIAGSLDWRNPANSNLWQGVSGINNPCPSGYRVPTNAELTNESANWSPLGSGGAYASPLKWLRAGNRANNFINNISSSGRYWSSTIFGSRSNFLSFSSGGSISADYSRANGLSVRCIKN